MAVSPEQIGLCGCWQVIGVLRDRVDLDPNNKNPESTCVGYYVSSCAIDEHSDEEMLAAIRQHWSAIENGSHHRRDVTFGEDACRVANRKGAHALSTLRNLSSGLFELEKDRGKTPCTYCPSWCRRMTFTQAKKLLEK
jgi:hypothetical protein